MWQWLPGTMLWDPPNLHGNVRAQEEMWHLGWSPQLLGVCSWCARERPEGASLPALGWKHQHWGGEGHMVQLQHFSALGL